MPKQNYIGPEAIIAKKREYLIPCVYHFYAHPPQIVRGTGIYLYDSTGKAYMDFYSGVSVNALGHCHPELTEIICRQVKTLQHTTTIYLTEPIVNLAEALAAILPGTINKTFFCASGSEANEGAALLATLYTGSSKFLAFQNSLHGRTKLGMSLTGLALWRTDPNPVEGITHVSAPYCTQCPFGQTYGGCNFECVQAVEKVIVASTSCKPAAMFVEPIQGNGGIITPPPEYYPKLRNLLNQHGILLIADEVQTGLGRTGNMYAMNHWDIVPDIITGGKALGGGTPIGYFSTTAAIASAYTKPGASTFGGNPVTAQVGLEFLKIIQRDELVKKAREKGDYFRSRLNKLMERFDCIREVRGLGLMIGMEVLSRNSQTAGEITDDILEKMKDKGFLLGKTGLGRNVLTFMPPLIVESHHLDQVVNALDSILQTI